MRADRLLSILLALQARGRVTGRALAAELEVSGRTVHRDMEALAAAGVPVLALRGARGGWELAEGWRTQVPGLDDGELRALLMAQPRVLGDRPLAAAAERALAKLMAALPQAQRARAVSMRERLYVDPTGWRGSAEDLSMLPVVQDAVTRDRRLWMRYRSAGREAAERVVAPLGLVAKATTWYLVAAADAGLRTYRVSRIEAARVIEEPVRRPAAFNLAEYWVGSSGRFVREWPHYDATLRIEPRAARWMRMYQRVTDLPGADEGDRPGWVTLIAHFGAEEEAVFVTCGLGPRVDVIAPDSLRASVLAAAEEVVARLRARSP
jgi:predicted DNA-binding transcriptional regulator YafY